jgi:hypothetical protein
MNKLPGRRWFQFRLRTILAFTAALAVFLAYQAHVVQQRRAAMEYVGIAFPGEPSSIGWVRRAMGDAAYRTVLIQQGNGWEIRDRLRYVYPEARVDYPCGGYPGSEFLPPYAYGKPVWKK